MAESDNYLSRIFGEGALKIDPVKSGDLILGSFHLKNSVPPLAGAQPLPDSQLELAVSQVICSGHFSGPTTFPAYRMIELCAMVQSGPHITHINKAEFRRIVKPGDVIVASGPGDGRTTLTRELSGRSQVVAQADISVADHGCNPHELGMLLEVAAQTIIANVGEAISGPATRNDEQLLFPLLLRLKSLRIINPRETEQLVVIPTHISNLDPKKRITASAHIWGDDDAPIAQATDIQFEFATSRKVDQYDTFGRNWLT